jgi:hypothetical protein
VTAFLAASEAGYCSGGIFVADGGFTVRYTERSRGGQTMADSYEILAALLKKAEAG